MSHGQKTLLTWVVIILLIAYLGNINVGAFVSSVLHAAQTVHQSNTGH